MSNRRLVYYDLQAEGCRWLFKLPLAGGAMGALCRPTAGHTACFGMLICFYSSSFNKYMILSSNVKTGFVQCTLYCITEKNIQKIYIDEFYIVDKNSNI